MGNRCIVVWHRRPCDPFCLHSERDKETRMYARVTSFKVDPARLDELPAKIKKMQPLARALPGIVDIYIAWRADGQGVVTAIYRTKAEADAAVARLQVLWGTVADLFNVAPRTDVYDTVEHFAG
jgi:hypothetical protein